MFPIQQRLLTPNPYSRPRKPLSKVRGVVIHWTANEGKGANAEANRRFFENRKLGKTGYGSAHYIVDDKEIVQCIPDNEMAYHVGATRYKTTRFGSYPNATLLGIEMCVNADGNFKVVYEQTVQLAAMLIKKYKLNPDTDLVRHYDITGKNCPAFFTSDHYGKINNSYATKYGLGSNADQAWLEFKKKVKACINQSSPSSSSTASSSSSSYPYNRNKGIGVVKVLADKLNIRKGPSFSAPIAKVANRGDTYYVYGEKNGLYNVGGNLWLSASPKYVQFIPHPKETYPYDKNKGIGVVKILADALNVRKGPSFDAPIEKVVKKNQVYYVYGEKNGLYNVGGNLWLSANPKYVQFTPHPK